MRTIPDETSFHTIGKINLRHISLFPYIRGMLTTNYRALDLEGSMRNRVIYLMFFHELWVSRAHHKTGEQFAAYQTRSRVSSYPLLCPAMQLNDKPQ